MPPAVATAAGRRRYAGSAGPQRPDARHRGAAGLAAGVLPDPVPRRRQDSVSASRRSRCRPTLPLLEWDGQRLLVTLNFGNFAYLVGDPLYVRAYLSSIRIAFVSALIALLVGYPMAYCIARSPEPRRNVLLMLVILPFWTSFLLRVYAWQGFLRATG